MIVFLSILTNRFLLSIHHLQCLPFFMTGMPNLGVSRRTTLLVTAGHAHHLRLSSFGYQRGVNAGGFYPYGMKQQQQISRTQP